MTIIIHKPYLHIFLYVMFIEIAEYKYLHNTCLSYRAAMFGFFGMQTFFHFKPSTSGCDLFDFSEFPSACYKSGMYINFYRVCGKLVMLLYTMQTINFSLTFFTEYFMQL